MDRDAARALLTAVAAGGLAVDAALERLAAGPLGPDLAGWTDLGFARLDTHRALRTGDPEVVYGEGKSPAQVVEILAALRRAHPGRPVLVTRADEAARAAVRAAFEPGELREDPLARCVAVGPTPAAAVDTAAAATPAVGTVGTVGTPAVDIPAVGTAAGGTAAGGSVAVLSAGTADGPVAAEVAFVATMHGAAVQQVPDVGVAGLHRLLAVRPVLDAVDCVVVVAGMDGALPSVVGGLVGVPLVAVPTSAGYGASLGGVAALLTMLNSCAPGVAVVNIDNGFGAGVFAARVARRARSRSTAPLSGDDPSPDSTDEPPRAGGAAR